MSLLIDTNAPDWMQNDALKERLSPLLPGVDVHCGGDDFDPSSILMLATAGLVPGQVAVLPNLRLVQKLGAGVESIVADPDLAPEVRVTRLKPGGQAREIAEYCVGYVLRAIRNMDLHAKDQARSLWNPTAPMESSWITIGILGLGLIGGRTARAFSGLDFRALGWSRTQKDIDGVECRHGDNALPGLLSECDFVASVLPSTPATRDLFDARTLAFMKPSATLINVGRGDLIVDDDLLVALEAGHLGHAVLDVFRTEPLARGHAFWTHPNITVTPHVSGWHLGDGLDDVAENYKRLVGGEPLLQQVDRVAGY